MTLSDAAQKQLDWFFETAYKTPFSQREAFEGLMEFSRGQQAKRDELIVGRTADYSRLATLDDGTQCLVFEPEGAGAGGAPANRLHILYWHGGAFVMDFLDTHFAACRRLAHQLSATVVAPLYPLLPDHGWRDAQASVEAAWRGMRDVFGCAPADVVVMGESAGGYLALATAQHALAAGGPVPRGVVAMSPMADIGCELPAEPKLARDASDPIVGAWSILDQGICHYWAPDAIEAPAYPPCLLHGPFEGLPPTLVVAGERETLLDDARAWAARAREAGVPCELVVGEGMWHMYPVYLDIPEGEAAFNRICDWVSAL